MKKFAKTIKSLVAVGIAAAIGLTAYVAVPNQTEARSMAAFIGQARYGSQANCFYEAEGGPIQRYCNGEIEWVIPIVYDNSGTATIRVTARGALEGTHNVMCRAYSATYTGLLYVGTSDVTTQNDGATEALQISVAAPGWGGVWAYCRMERYTRLFNVHY